MACDLARQFKARLIFLHVTDKPILSYFERSTDLSSEQLQRKLFESLHLPADYESGLQIEHVIKEGNAVDEILTVAKETLCDLIVMGAHESKGLSQWFSTNVTAEVIRKSPCSVLVAKSVPQEAPVK